MGKTSGKRTLSDAMDHSRQSKQAQKVGSSIQSKFFTPSKTPTPQAQNPKSRPSTEPGPSRLKENKENVYIVIDDDDVEEAETAAKMKAMGCGASLVGQRNDEIEIDEEWEFSKVDQEDGYISLGSSDGEDNEAEVLSSPARSGRTPKRRRRAGTPNRVEEEDTDASVGLISSPFTIKQSRPTRNLRSRSLSPRSKGRTSDPPVSERLSSSQGSNQVVDLRHSFADGLNNTDDIEGSQKTVWSSDTPSSHSPPTPATPANASQLSVIFDIDLEGPEEIEDQNSTVRHLAVANGWREKWAHARTPSVLRRRETNVTPTGRHNVLHTLPRTNGGAASRPAPASSTSKGRSVQGRKSLAFLESVTTSKAGARRSL